MMKFLIGIIVISLLTSCQVSSISYIQDQNVNPNFLTGNWMFNGAIDIVDTSVVYREHSLNIKVYNDSIIIYTSMTRNDTFLVGIVRKIDNNIGFIDLEMK